MKFHFIFVGEKLLKHVLDVEKNDFTIKNHVIDDIS